MSKMSGDTKMNIAAPKESSADKAVRNGNLTVGVCGLYTIVLGVEKKPVSVLEEERRAVELCQLDDHVLMAFSGNKADGKVLVNLAREECQTYKLRVEDPVSVSWITDHIATVMRKRFEGSQGHDGFGVACLIGGFDYDGTPHLFQIVPNGNAGPIEHAHAAGRKCELAYKFICQSFRKYSDAMGERSYVRLAIGGLMAGSNSDGGNVEVAVLKRGKPMKRPKKEEIAKLVAEIKSIECGDASGPSGDEKKIEN